MRLQRLLFFSLAVLSLIMLFTLALAQGNQPKPELTQTTTFGIFAGVDYVMHQGTVAFEESPTHG